MEFPWNVGRVGEHVSAGGQALTQGQRGNLCSLRNVENQAFLARAEIWTAAAAVWV